MAKPVEWRSVWSTVANRVGYDNEQEELLVEWKRTGRISVYFPKFPFDEFDKLSKTVSVGTMIKNEIVPKYQHRYLA
jgi:KTSC domain